MRKLSKNRAEEDGVSSSNGSVGGEGEPAPDATNGAAEADEASAGGAREEGDAGLKLGESEGEGAREDTPPPRDPPKKRGASARKSRVKKEKKEQSVEEDEPEEEYEVEEILESKKIKGKLHYLIHWKGYSSASDSWEPAETVSCPELLQKFKENGPKKNTKKDLKRKHTPTNTKKKGTRGRPAGSVKKAKKEDFDYESADAEAEYEVERILEVHHKKSGKREFLIHWKGWSNKYDSWEPEEHLNCSDLITKFMTKVNAARDTDQRSLRVAPKVTPRFTLQQKSSGRRLSKRSGQRQRVRYDDAE